MAHTIVYPRPGVTIYLSGGTHGFKEGPVPMRVEHADALAPHVMTEAEKAAADAARALPAPAEPAEAEKPA